MKVGITERGDASIDMSWVDKLNTVDAAVIISKNLTEELIEQLVAHKEKVVFHMTITGYGGTFVEPNVPPKQVQYIALEHLIFRGFPSNQIVIRIDPIIPTAKGVEKFVDILTDIKSSPYLRKITRFRVSVLDMYPHVWARFKETCAPDLFSKLEDAYGAGNFQAKEAYMTRLDMTITQYVGLYAPHITIESCAEPNLHAAVKKGCISTRDVDMLGIERNKPIDFSFVGGASKQRKECRCGVAKTELLTHKGQCPNGCVYCYWR